MIVAMMKVRNKWKNAPHALTHRYETRWSQRSRPNQEMNCTCLRHVHVPNELNYSKVLLFLG
jgi:hypothetical protein